MRLSPRSLKGVYRHVVVYTVLGLTLAQILTGTVDLITLTIGWLLAIAIWVVERMELRP